MKRKVILAACTLVMVFGLCACSPFGALRSTVSGVLSNIADMLPFQKDEPGEAPAQSIATEPAPSKKPDLTGDWVQINADSEKTYRTAHISGNTIEVYYILGAFQDLYWSGSFKAPADDSGMHSWESRKKPGSQAATWVTSDADSKTFTYHNGVLSFPIVQAGREFIVEMKMGTTPSARPEQETEAGPLPPVGGKSEETPEETPRQAGRAERPAMEPVVGPVSVQMPELEPSAPSAVAAQSPVTQTPPSPPEAVPSSPETPAAPIVSTPSGNYVGSSLSNMLHGPACRRVETIPPGSEIWFETRDAAFQQGYEACEMCGGN